jgi:hypothetical protein
MAHQQALHSPPSEHIDPVELQEIRLEIEQLYAIKSQVPSQYHDTYYPANMHRFHQTSSLAQLQSYIRNYKPVITKSIKTANTISKHTKRIDHFTGFHRQRPPTSNQRQHQHPVVADPIEPLPRLHTTTPALQQTTLHRFTQPTHIRPTQNPYVTKLPRLSPAHHHDTPVTRTTKAQREQYPRKHSRWKPPQSTLDRFKQFFKPIPSHHQIPPFL